MSIRGVGVPLNTGGGSLKRLPTFIGKCCREWILAVGGRGTCGLCGETPTYLRPDEAN